MIQIAITPTGLRYHEARLPSPYNYPFHTLSDSTGKTYSWVRYEVEVAPDEWEYAVSFVVATFDEGATELNVIAVIPPPPAYYTMYGHGDSGGMWHVYGYVDDKDDFYAAISTENYSEEKLYRWDWGTNQWVDLPGWVQISELGWRESFTYLLKPNKPLGWVVLDENKVANVFADGNVVTTSNNVITAVGPYVYTYNPLTWAIEIFSPEKNSATLGDPIAIHDLECQLRDPGYWDWFGRNVRTSLVPGDFSIVYYHEYDKVALEINLEWVKEYYQFEFTTAFYYLGQHSDSDKPRFWASLVGCSEKP